MLDDPCVGCEQAEATTTCGAPEHPCRLCQWCRDSLDGREYDDDDECTCEVSGPGYGPPEDCPVHGQPNRSE